SGRSRRRRASAVRFSPAWARSTSGSSPRDAGYTRPCTTSCYAPSGVSSPTRTTRSPRSRGCRSRRLPSSSPTPTTAAWWLRPAGGGRGGLRGCERVLLGGGGGGGGAGKVGRGGSVRRVGGHMIAGAGVMVALVVVAPPVHAQPSLNEHSVTVAIKDVSPT